MEMTITEALVKLKMFDKRIHDGVNRLDVGHVLNKTRVAPPNSKTDEEFKQNFEACLQSVQALIDNRNAMKAAIVKSNALTLVKIGSKEMTVADAIERKNSIKHEKLLLNKLEATHNSLNQQYTTALAKLEMDANDFVQKQFGNVEKANAEEVNKSRQIYMDNQKLRLVASDKIPDVVKTMRTDIEEFEANVDVQLSVSNSTTKISV